MGAVVDLRTHLRRAARARWAKATDAEKKAPESHAAKSYWARLTPEERSAEMKRRAKEAEAGVSVSVNLPAGPLES
jgi:hypothetical protein